MEVTGVVALALGAAHAEALDRLVLVDPAVWLEDDQARRRPGSVEERRAGLKERQALGRRVLTEQMRTVYLGTSPFAVAVLERLASSDHRPRVVVTRPDRPRGRGRRLSAPPVADSADPPLSPDVS